ncbi:MAG: putative spermine/spermidine synthase protein, spermidine synthase [Chloroflexi bacterium]|nr:putative spermine/spermidine synthase protein, spermidine synthase [Chloroflexota bacterium]
MSEHRVWIGEDEGQTALLIDGVVQSVFVHNGPMGPGYWSLMLPDVRPARALILGMGGGTIAHLLARQFGRVPTIGVENDPSVIRLGKSAFGLTDLGADVVESDAFAYVGKANGPFDYVAVDLFADGRIPPRVFGRPFLREIKRLLSPGGMAAINFFKDRRSASRIARLEAIFPRVAVVTSRENIVARCRAR